MCIWGCFRAGMEIQILALTSCLDLALFNGFPNKLFWFKDYLAKQCSNWFPLLCTHILPGNSCLELIWPRTTPKAKHTVRCEGRGHAFSLNGTHGPDRAAPKQSEFPDPQNSVCLPHMQPKGTRWNIILGASQPVWSDCPAFSWSSGQKSASASILALFSFPWEILGR